MFVQYYAHPTNIRMGRSDQIIMKLIEVEDTSVTVGLQASGQGKVNYAALIAVGAVALIGVIVTLICCCRKKKDSKGAVDDNAHFQEEKQSAQDTDRNLDKTNISKFDSERKEEATEMD